MADAVSPISDLAQGKTAALYSQLKSDLIAGRLEPGQRLSEASLSREYGVSRTPIREATAMLVHDGLLERHGMVIRVRLRSLEEIIDIYRVRVFLEGAIAYDAASRRQEMDLVRLWAAVDAEALVDPEDEFAVVEANRVLHRNLAAAARNVSLQDLQARLTVQLATLPISTLKQPGRLEEARSEHRLIVQAVEKRDAVTAQAIAEQHMSRARDIRLNYSRQAGSFDGE